MDKFTTLNGLAAPLDRANIDTDQIIPKQFLGSIKRAGYAEACFADWRKEPDFILNQAAYSGVNIILARRNFGCGSSREHAPWALRDFGIKAVIAPSFGDIFFNNSCKNGLLPVVLTEAEVDAMFERVGSGAPLRVMIDLASQSVSLPGEDQSYLFPFDPFRKDCLLNGLDDISLTLRHAGKIRDFESRRAAQAPWYFG